MKKYPISFVLTLAIVMLFIFSCGKENDTTPIQETSCYDCTTIYIETTDPPTPSYPDTLIFEEEYCGNLEELERRDTATQEILGTVLTMITTVTCQ